MDDAKITDPLPHSRIVSSDTAQLREDLENLRRHHNRVTADTALYLIGRLLGIVERLEDRMLRR